MNSYAPPKLRQIVTEAVFRRSRIFLSTVFVVAGLVLIGTLLMHKRYQAEAKLIVQNLRSLAPLTTSPSEHLVTPNDVSTTEINNEADLLESAGVARRALGASVSGADSEAEEREIKDLQKRLDVQPVHQSSTINVKLQAYSPEEATAQLQRILDAYFQERAGTGQSSGAAGFFDAQARQKSTQMDADQQALTDFEVQHQIANLDDQKKLQVTRIGALQDQLSAAEAALASTQSRLAAQRHQLALTPSRTRTTERSITNQYSQERLNTSLVDLENRRTELLKRYPPTDRQVIEINEKIATTRMAISSATSNPAADAATDVNPTYQQLTTAIAITTSDVSATAAQKNTIEVQLREARVRLTELEEATAKYNELQRKLGQSQDDYKLYAQKRDEAQVSEALDNAKMFDVTLVQQPIASAEPVRPKPVLYMAVGIAFAVFLGILLALYADTSAEQVFTPSQLDQLSGLRTIATFADEDDADAHESQNRLEYRRVLVAIRAALGADVEGLGASTAPSLGSTVAGATIAWSGHDEAVRQGKGKPAGYCVAFTSALSGEGVSYLVANTATEAARLGASRVAVLDMASLLQKFETEEDVSFGMKFNAASQFWTLALHGDEGGAAVKQGETQGQFAARLRPLLIEARKEFDYLFMDCPSFQGSTLASELDICIDGYVAVVSAGRTRKQNLEQMTATLKETRAPLLGYVLNRRRYPVPGWLHRLIW